MQETDFNGKVEEKVLSAIKEMQNQLNEEIKRILSTSPTNKQLHVSYRQLFLLNRCRSSELHKQWMTCKVREDYNAVKTVFSAVLDVVNQNNTEAISVAQCFLEMLRTAAGSL